MDSFQRLPQGRSDNESNPTFVRILSTSLSRLKLVARSLLIARHQVFDVNHSHFALLQGFVFDMDAVKLESGKPVTRILATCTPNIVQVLIKFQKNEVEV